jgi:hypothetical protein
MFQPACRPPACHPSAPQSCFRSAIKGGFTGLQILNHVDHDQGSWRNELDMNPQQKFEGFSYEDVVVRPAADALRTVSRPSTKVRGALVW